MKNKYSQIEGPPDNLAEAAALFGFSRLIYAALAQEMYPGLLAVLSAHSDILKDFDSTAEEPNILYDCIVDLYSDIMGTMDGNIVERMAQDFGGVAWDDDGEMIGLAQ